MHNTEYTVSDVAAFTGAQKAELEHLLRPIFEKIDALASRYEGVKVLGDSISKELKDFVPGLKDKLSEFGSRLTLIESSYGSRLSFIEYSLDLNAESGDDSETIGYEVELYEDFQEGCDFKVIVLEHEENFVTLALDDTPISNVREDHLEAIRAKLRENRELEIGSNGVRYFGKMIALRQRPEQAPKDLAPCPDIPLLDDEEVGSVGPADLGIQLKTEDPDSHRTTEHLANMKRAWSNEESYDE